MYDYMKGGIIEPYMIIYSYYSGLPVIHYTQVFCIVATLVAISQSLPFLFNLLSQVTFWFSNVPIL